MFFRLKLSAEIFNEKSTFVKLHGEKLFHIPFGKLHETAAEKEDMRLFAYFICMLLEEACHSGIKFSEAYSAADNNKVKIRNARCIVCDIRKSHVLVSHMLFEYFGALS